MAKSKVIIVLVEQIMELCERLRSELGGGEPTAVKRPKRKFTRRAKANGAADAATGANE